MTFYLPFPLSSALLVKRVDLADGLALASITAGAETFLASELITFYLLSPRANTSLL